MNMETDTERTELLRPEVVRFPRARLRVSGGNDDGAEVILEGQTVLVGSDESCQLRLSDPAVSRRHLELSGGPGGYHLRDLQSTNGVMIEGIQVFSARLIQRARVTVGHTELLFEPEISQRPVTWPISRSNHFGEALGRSIAMRRVFAVLERAASREASILLEGESGTGRELLAREVHGASPRCEHRFVVVDVASLPEALLESDLFGTELSAYTSSRAARPGAFEEADGGTLFLDEVSAIPLAIQARLLRALETGEVKRNGSNHARRVDVRVLASTTKDLDAEVKAGRFRPDLLLRLSTYRVQVPSLRERPEDIPLLAAHFQTKLKGSEALPPETVEMLVRHHWTGNVGELRNSVERLITFPDLGSEMVEGVLGPRGHGAKPLPEDSRDSVLSHVLSLPYHEAKERLLDGFERRYFAEHLRAAGGVVTRAARRMQLPRQSVHRMLRRLGVHASDDN